MIRIALDPLLLLVPFLLTGVWVVLYSNQRVRHDHYHHDAPQTPQKAVERISSTPVLNSPRIAVLANPGVALLAQEARKRLEVEEF